MCQCQPRLDTEQDEPLCGFRIAVVSPKALLDSVFRGSQLVAFQVHECLCEVGGHGLQGIPPGPAFGDVTGAAGELGRVVDRSVHHLE